MLVVDVKLKGYVASCDRSARSLFWAKDSFYDRGLGKYQTLLTPFYLKGESRNQIEVGFGALLTLMSKNPGVVFRVKQRIGDLPYIPLTYIPIDGLQLRTQQEEAFEAVSNKLGGQIKMPTGGGKTECMYLVGEAARQQHNVMVLIPTDFLKRQFILRAVQKYHMEDVVVYDTSRKHTYPATGMMFVSHPKSVINDLGNGANSYHRKTIGTILIDEGQKMRAEMWQRTLAAMPNVVRSFAFSATPAKAKNFTYFDQITLHDALIYSGSGPFLYESFSEDLEDNHIDRPNVIDFVTDFWKDSRFFSEIRETNDWTYIREFIQNNDTRTDLIVEIIRLISSLNRTSYVPISTRTLAEKLMKTANLPDLACTFGGGENFTLSKDYTTTDFIKAVQSGKINHVIGTSHADLGMDLPALSTLLLTEGVSFEQTIQRVGRVVRPNESQKSVVINLCESGVPLLERQAALRRSAILLEHKTYSRSVHTFKELKRALKNERIAA